MGELAGLCIAVALGLAALATAACDVKEEGKAGARGGGDSVPRMTAEEFYRDYSSLKGADRLNKYGDGVAISGKVMKSVYLGQDEGVQLWLEVNGPGHIAARFHDGGAAAKQRRLKAGDNVALQCQFNGKPDAILFLVDCVLE